MKYTFVFLIALLATLSSCKQNAFQAKAIQSSKKKTLCGTWQIADYTPGKDQAVDADALLQAAKSKTIVKDGLLYSFFPDSSFTSVSGEGAYQLDRWHFVDDGESLHFPGQKTTFTLDFYEEKERQYLKLEDQSSGAAMVFVKAFDLLDQFKEDPFYPENNTWRVKTQAPEGTEALHDRLGNYFRHLAYLLKSASERKQSFISFVYSQGPVQIYNGGIGILPNFPESWGNAFYNTEEAEIAYQMFNEYLKNAQYQGVGTGDWYKDDYEILTNIYGDVKSGKFPRLSDQ
jgi:hypothetical protein